MKKLFQSASRLGRVVARDRGKILSGLGSVALEGLVGFLRQLWLQQRLAELESESEEARRRLSRERGKRFRAKNAVEAR